MWGELDFCTGGLDMTGLLIGNEVFLGDGSKTEDAAKLAWWAGQGQKVLRAYGSALKGQMSSRLLHKDELSGKVISQPEYKWQTNRRQIQGSCTSNLVCI